MCILFFISSTSFAMDCCRCIDILNSMPTPFKKVGTGANKRLGKLWNAQKAPVYSIPQVNRLIW